MNSKIWDLEERAEIVAELCGWSDDEWDRTEINTPAVLALAQPTTSPLVYYAQTVDFGKTWTTVDGRKLDLPLSQPDNPARVIDYESQGRLQYTVDLNFDPDGHPILLYVTSPGHQPGPANDPREWTLTRWNGRAWETSVATRSDHNYDLGSLYITSREWVIIGPTEKGPQPYGTGGEIALWFSADEGQTWARRKQITRKSESNHAYARRPLQARDPFYLFWADGDPSRESLSRLYFGTSTGDRHWQLPYDMAGEFATPLEIVRLSDDTGGEQSDPSNRKKRAKPSGQPPE